LAAIYLLPLEFRPSQASQYRPCGTGSIKQLAV
jgi:hypothetical protein